MSAAATSPAWMSIFWGMRSGAKMAVSAPMRTAAAIANRVRSRRVNVTGGVAGRLFSIGGQWGWSVRLGRVGGVCVGGVRVARKIDPGEGLGDDFGDAPAVGA